MRVYTLLGVAGVVLAAGYILWMLQRTFYGPVLEQYNGVADATIMDRVYMFAFVALIMLVGIYPAILTNVIQLGISPITSLIGG
jgi:NADH-quinone oxidoreductase subunit M